MRSQLFGIVVRTRLMYELLLECPLKQTMMSLNQLFVEGNALVARHPLMESRLLLYLNDPMNFGVEFFLNTDWEDEIVDTIYGVRLSGEMNENPRLLMERLKRALSWLWPKVRETIIVAQLSFAETIDNKTFFTAMIGWNDGANAAETDEMDGFVPHFLQRLANLGYGHEYLSSPESQAKNVTKQPNGGPRLDTLKKLQDLVALRSKHLRLKTVTINRMQACDQAGLAPATVKKHAPILYDRWYEPTYEGDVQ